MLRSNRHHLRQSVWHITHRCHRVLKCWDRQAWILWLSAAGKPYGLCILDYAVTSNHIHLLVRDQGRGELARSPTACREAGPCLHQDQTAMRRTISVVVLRSGLDAPRLRSATWISPRSRSASTSR
jgi:hypothetical protein